MTRTRVTLLTVGDPDRVTGGYLFHRRLAERASRHGAELTFVSIPDVPLPWAIATGPVWLRAPAMRTADVLVLDSLAAGAAAPWLSHVAVPILGMLHQLPGGMDANSFVRSFRAPFDRRAYRRCRLLMVASEGFGWSKMPNTSQLEIFGPDDREHTYFTTGPVPEFLVDDIFAAADELRAAGVELLGDISGTAEEGWLHFRAPDGNVYGLTSSDSYSR